MNNKLLIVVFIYICIYSLFKGTFREPITIKADDFTENELRTFDWNKINKKPAVDINLILGDNIRKPTENIIIERKYLLKGEKAKKKPKKNIQNLKKMNFQVQIFINILKE